LNFGSEKGVNNTTQLNPLRLNPFIIVDSLSGDWNKQNYELEAKIASPIVANEFIFGLGVKYNVSTGARQRDPRPLNTSNNLILTPSATFLINEINAVGINGLYHNFVEDFSVENINTYTVHNMYKLIGLGEYIGSVPTFIGSSGITRRYEGNKFGGAIQYVFKGEKLRFLAEGFANYNSESARDGSSNPQEAGKHEYLEYGTNVEAVLKNGNYAHRFDLSWSQQNIDNIEYHQYQDSDTRQFVTLFSQIFNTNLVTNTNLNYMFSKTKEDVLDWNLGGSVVYAGWDNKYSANESQQTVDRLSYGLSFKKFFYFNSGSAFLVELNPSISKSIDSKFAYSEKSYSTNFVANNILYPTNSFLSADYFNISASIQYNFKQSKNNTQLYIKLSENYSKPTKSIEYFSKSMHRLDWQLSLGILTF